MGRKRTPRQRNQQNAAKNARSGTGGNITSKARKQNGNIECDAQHENTNMRQSKVNVPMKHDPICSPPKGLSNLGNTCFFNSVMQNLCRTPGLLYKLSKTAKRREMTFEDKNIAPLTCDMPSLFKLSQSFLDFLITMSTSADVRSNTQKNRTRTESPKALFSQICAVSPRFRGFQQQDSQELLHCLLEGIKAEEIRRRKQAILTKLGLLGKKVNEVNDDQKELVKNYGRIASKVPTVVDIIFGGETVSSVLCDECGRVTQVHEEFLDIPLPIVETVPMHHHNGTSSKKSSAKNRHTEEIVANADTSDCDEDASNVKSGSVSKYSRKKQRDKERKNKSRKKKIRSPNNQEVEENLNEVKHTESEKVFANSKIDEGENSENFPSIKGDDHSLNSCNTASSVKNNDVVGDKNATGDTHQLSELGKSDQNVIRNDDDTITELCKEMDGFSLSQNNDSIKDEVTEVQAGTELNVATENILSGHIETKQENVSSNKDCNAKPIGDGTDIPLLGGKPHASDTVSINGKNTEVSSFGCKNNSAEASTANNSSVEKSDVDKTPSSGNDEKSESENLNNENGPSLFETPMKTAEVKFTDLCKKLPSSLSHRYEPGRNECSVISCLHKFTMAEMLTGSNKFGCEECTKRKNKGVAKPKTVYCNASKQMLIKTPPLVLTLQLKRFQQTGRNLRKFSKGVEIPSVLDISSFCSRDSRDHVDDNGEIRYKLYGIVEHSGSLSRGHYTSYVSIRPESKSIQRALGASLSEENSEIGESEAHEQWFHISDTSVSTCTLEKALSSNAYLLFYERIL